MAKRITKSHIWEKYELSQTDKKLIEYRVKFPEITHEELSKILDVSRETVTRSLNKPVVKKALAELEDNFGADWIKRIIAAKEKASRKLVRHIDSSNPAISIRACEQILQLDKLNTGSDEQSKPIKVEIIENN